MMKKRVEKKLERPTNKYEKDSTSTLKSTLYKDINSRITGCYTLSNLEQNMDQQSQVHLKFKVTTTERTGNQCHSKHWKNS